MWPCTGENCGECTIRNPFRLLTIKSHKAAIYKYYKIFHQYNNESFIVCKKCNMGVNVSEYMLHLSDRHGRVKYKYSFPRIMVGMGDGIFDTALSRSNGDGACIDYKETIAMYPQLIYLSIVPGDSIDNIIDGDDIRNVLAKADIFNGSNIISKIICIFRDDEMYLPIVNKIIQKMTVCADCGMDYDCVPSNEMISSHVADCPPPSNNIS